MNTLKKLIFLKSEDKSHGMGILSLEQKSQNIFGTLKTYQTNFNGDYILGIRCENQIIKQNVNIDNNTYNFILSDKLDLNQNIGCVILKVEGSQVTPILWGNEKNENYKSSIVKSLKESLSKLHVIGQSKKIHLNNKSPNVQQLENVQTNISELYQDCENKDIIDKHNNEKLDSIISSQHTPHHSNYISMTDPTYNNYTKNTTEDIESFSQISLKEESVSDEVAIASDVAELFESDEKEVNQIIDNELDNINNGNHQFYDMISDQLRELFDRYPQERNLSKLIDDSTWVKIESDYDNKYYVVGIIRNNNDIKYICYGVPGTFNQEPPQEIKEFSQWLPVDVKDPYSHGYWVMYQDADTGENIFLK